MSARPRVRAAMTRTGDPIRDSALGRVTETVDEIVRLNAEVWRQSLVPPTLLEIIRLRNARTVNCVYCKAVRYDLALEAGFNEARAESINEGYAQSSALSAREKLAVALADAYLGFPAGVSAELAARLATEFSRAEIASLLVALIAFNITSRTAVSIGGMPEEPLPTVIVSAPVL